MSSVTNKIFVTYKPAFKLISAGGVAANFIVQFSLAANRTLRSRNLTVEGGAQGTGLGLVALGRLLHRALLHGF